MAPRLDDTISSLDCGDGVTVQARQRGIKEEGERITVFEAPVDRAREWLDQRSKEGVVVDLKVFAGLYFVVAGAES